MARQRARLVHLPQPFLGLPDSGVGQRRSEASACGRLRFARRLKADFGDYPRDKDGNVNMHRPWIDNLVRVNPDDPTGKSHMHRISDVLDCWFESGSMSFAQFHYPFENKEKFEQHFPADYIVEYIGQTRGWFYLLHVMATALFDRPRSRT